MDLRKEFERYDGLGLAALVRAREVTATEVLETTIERIEARNPAGPIGRPPLRPETGELCAQIVRDTPVD